MTIRTIVIAATFLAATFSSGASAQIINGCIKSNGTLKIVVDLTDCSSREAPISWNQQGPPGPEAPTFKLFDANDRLLGLPLFFNYSVTVVDLWDRNVSAFVRLDRASGELKLLSRGLQYTEPNCQGEPFIIVSIAGSVVRTEDSVNGVRHWVARREPVVTIEEVSVRAPGQCSPANPVGGIRLVVHADQISLTDLEWTYPVPGPLFAVPIPAP